MSNRSQNMAKLFLENLHLNETKSTFEKLINLVESLENKPDPDPTEVKLVHNIYSFIEKLNILENNLQSYATKESNLMGTKLSSLYEKLLYTGSIYSD